MMIRQFKRQLHSRTSRSLFILLSFVALFSACSNDDKEIAPQPGFEFETSEALEYGLPLQVQFMDKSAGTASSSQYLWDFGDGTTSSEKNPLHAYAKGGDYDVKLKLNNGGKSQEVTRKVSLTSPLVGTWVLDSIAPSSIDSFGVDKAIKTAFEFGNAKGWDGKKWTAVGDDGYSTFWSNTIFKDNYLGRKSFFSVAYTFTADGIFKRDEKGKLPAAVYWPEERDYAETEDWKNTEGVSLNDWKSGEYKWDMAASVRYQGRSELAISGKKGGFVGIYFSGNPSQTPSDVYNYTIASVNNNQLILVGVSNLFLNPDNVFVMKFKRVQ